MELIEEYNEVRECEYKGEHYSVRDNGAILRHSKEGSRVRPLDNRWTFGKKNSQGYMSWGSERVHRIVACAFHEMPKDKTDIVVDHIDTNRCNNRPENLRYVTRWENILNNPLTMAKIIAVWGSIEAFLKDPKSLKLKSPEDKRKYEWMRPASKEELNNAHNNWLKITNNPNPHYTKNPQKFVTESIYKESSNDKIMRYYGYDREADNKEDTHEEISNFYPSETPNCMQEDWKTPTEFLACPKDGVSIDEYYNNLVKGDPFSRNRYGSTFVSDFAKADNGTSILVITDSPDNEIKRWAVAKVYIMDGKYVHKSVATCFEREGAEYYFVTMQGKEWTKELPSDVYC